MYLHATPWFPSAIEDHYGIDVSQKLRDYLATRAPDQWAATTNQAMRVADLDAFVEWFTPTTPAFRDDLIGSAVHERAVPLFCLLNGIDIACVEGVLEHEQRASHGTDPRTIDEATRRTLEVEPLLAGADLYARYIQSQRAVADERGRVEHLQRILHERNLEFARERGRIEAHVGAVSRRAMTQSRRANRLQRVNDSVTSSRSWRLTRPLRSAGRGLRRVLGRSEH